MISIRSSYHPIEAAILWCNLADYEEEILSVDLSTPGSLLKHFPQWPLLHYFIERINDTIGCGDLPATYLGCPISLANQIHRQYCCVRRADLLVWFIRTFPDQRPSFLFPPSLHHSECISLNMYLVKQAELEASQRAIDKMCYASVENGGALVKRRRQQRTTKVALV